jgi:hypothetical protein
MGLLVAYFSDMQENLGCPLPCPELCRALPAALPAAPAPLPMIDVQVTGREPTPLATRLGYSSKVRERGLKQLRGVGEAHDAS